MRAKVIAVVNQKGGVGKTATTLNLGVGLAKHGKRVLLIDADPQGSLTLSLGCAEPDKLEITLANLLEKVINDTALSPREGILRSEEGVDFVPCNIELSALDVALVNEIARETKLKEYVDAVKDGYDYVLIDCMPSLGMMTINALTAADSVVIPVQSHYLSLRGLEQLIGSIARTQRKLNPNLQIMGALITMVDSRTNFAKDIASTLREHYAAHLPVFATEIPYSIRAAESSATGKSIFTYDAGGKVSLAYQEFVKEVLAGGAKTR